MNLNKVFIIFWVMVGIALFGWYSYYMENKNKQIYRDISIEYKAEIDSLKKIETVNSPKYSYWYVVYTRPDGINYSYGMKAIRLDGQDFSYVKAAQILTLEHETYDVNLFIVNALRINSNSYYEYLYEKGSVLYNIKGINTLREINKEYRDSLLGIKTN